MRRPILCAVLLLACGLRPAHADQSLETLETTSLDDLLAEAGPVETAPSPAPTVSLSYDPGYDSVAHYFSHWFERVDRAQGE